MDLVLSQIAYAVRSMSLLEAAAVSCGLFSVWYSKNRSILVYPTGLMSVLIYVYLCYQHGIYADMALNMFYGLMSLYGWYRWQNGAYDDDRIVIGSLTGRGQLNYFVVSCALWLLIYLWLTKSTDSTVPILDSFTTGFAITGMLLMAEKKIENWIYWIVVDAISIPLFWYKGLYLTSLQFFIFCILAWLGLREWRRYCPQRTEYST